MESIEMTNIDRSAHPSSAVAYGSSGRVHSPDATMEDVASKGAAALRDTKAGVESVIAEAGEKGQRALSYASQKGQEAMGNVRTVGDTVAVAIERSVTKRPYTTLALAVAAGFVFGATWRR
jgi:ElaB/YqjD/DUF883 family membrane-anchored ribosome-binding protein